MSKVSTATLKSYFKTGDTPTEANFINVFDTLKNLDDASWDVDITGVSLQNCRIDVANVLFENAVGSVFMSNRHSSGNTNTINKSYNGAPASTVVSSSNYNLNGTSYAGI